MKCHIRNLSRKFPGTQCALVVVRVPAESESPSDPNRSSDSVQDTDIDLPTEFKLSEWICTVDEPPRNDRRAKMLQRLQSVVPIVRNRD